MANIDRTNGYEMLDYWLKNISPKYFDMENIGLNRAGTFGNINEVMAHTSESIVNENSILYNELFITRAQLPETIYAYASQYNVSNTGATPSMMQCVLLINESTLLEKSLKDESSSYFVIDCDSEIVVDDKFTFMLDYDVRINIKRDIEGNFGYTANYIVGTLSNPISNITSVSNPFLKVSKIAYNKQFYIAVLVNVHQVSKTVVNKNIYSENFIDYYCFEIESGSRDQLADFSVYYRSPNSEEFEQIDKILIDKEAEGTKFCYYQLKDKNTVLISFSTIARYFQPEPESELKFVFYNTLGSEGNFRYKPKKSNIKFFLKSNKYDYREVVIKVYNPTDAVGGADALTYNDIKKISSTNASTCNVLGTEIDLNKYFDRLKLQSKVLFVYKEDDVKRRMFGSYSRYTDENGYIMPTNTLDIDMYDEDFDINDSRTQRSIIKCGTKFIYQSGSRVTKKIDMDNILFKPEFVFTNPFNIIVNKQPYFFIDYYLMSIIKEYKMEYTEINKNVNMNFLMDSVYIKRNALKSDSYDINFEIRHTVEGFETKYAIINEETYKFIEDANIIKIKGIIYNESSISHYFDCEMYDVENAESSVPIYKYRAKLTTDDYISNGSLRMINGIHDCGDSTIDQPFIPGSCKIKFVIFYENPNSNNSDVYHKCISDIEGYDMTNIFSIPEQVNFMLNMNKLMYSTVKYFRKNNKIGYRIKEVPLIKAEYLDIEENSTEFYERFLSDYALFMDQLPRVENAFDINMKLYNTYGKSYYFYVNENKNILLDKINLSLNLKIKLNPNKLGDYGLQAEIITFIRNYVESINDNDDLNFYTSNLTTMLEKNFIDIIYANFEYMNNYDMKSRYIEKNFPTNNYLDRNLLLDFVPEYLNINRNFSTRNSSTEDINIKFI